MDRKTVIANITTRHENCIALRCRVQALKIQIATLRRDLQDAEQECGNQHSAYDQELRRAIRDGHLSVEEVRI